MITASLTLLAFGKRLAKHVSIHFSEIAKFWRYHPWIQLQTFTVEEYNITIRAKSVSAKIPAIQKNYE